MGSQPLPERKTLWGKEAVVSKTISQEKRELSQAAEETISAMEELASNSDAPEGVQEELEEDVKFFQYMKEKLDGGYSWTRNKLRNLGRRIRDFAHTVKNWLVAAYNAIVTALGKALAWLVRAVETALTALANVADRFIRVVFPNAEDTAQAQLEDINAAAAKMAAEEAA